MALLLADGFDFYNVAADMQYVGAPWAAAPAQGPATSPTPYGVGQSANVSSSNPLMQSAQFSNEPTIYISFNLYGDQAFTGGSSVGAFTLHFIDMSTPGTSQVSLVWALDGNLYVRSGMSTAFANPTSGTVLGTFAHGMAANSWCHWQIKVVINNTTGSVELRKNNNTVDDYNLTGVNTRGATSNNYANTFSLFGVAATHWYIDDCYVNSASGAAPNTWPTQLRAIQLMPNGDTAQADMTPSTGVTHYTMVNEAKMNSDTNYVYGSTAGNTDIYNMADLTTVPTAIPLVVVRHSLRKSDTGLRTGTTHVVSGGTTLDATAVTLATTYQWQNTPFTTDPNTSAAWTYAAVNALQAGPKVVS